MPQVKPALDSTLISDSSSAQTLIEKSVAPSAFLSRVEDWTQFETMLELMNQAYKQARFNTDLRDAALSLHTFVRNHEKKETSTFWKALTLIYELNDIFHFDSHINDVALNHGKLIYNELRAHSLEWETPDHISDEERKLAQQKVLYCTCRGNELKRRGQIESAAKLFEWLLDFTSTTLKTDEFPCYGTQSILTYHLGSIYRVLERHNLAEDMYTRCLELLYQRATSQNDPSERLFIIRKQAMAIGIGYGWINATRGSLRRAENALTTARSLLAGIDDPIVPPFIELLYGTIKRCRAGKNKERLTRAIESLAHAKASFDERGHDRYIPRACWELALAFNLLGDFEEVQKNLDRVDEYAEKVGHAKWKTNVNILRSRLQRNRGDYSGALKEAEAAVIKAQDCKSVLPLTDAYITRGEAKLALVEAQNNSAESYEAARKDFEKALDLIGTYQAEEHQPGFPSNPKIAGVCQLRIAQCFVRDGDETNARMHFATWEVLRPSVEHEWVRELAEEVKTELNGLQMNFTISAKDPTEWNYVRNVAQLRNWLMTQSLRYTKRNYSAAAELIGVKRGTLYQWQDDSGSQLQRARTKTKASS
jgi:tetratricopeptide (TPR) repeat protein